MKKIIIIHYRAVEDYPPVMNLANYLASDRNLLVKLITTFTRQNRKIFSIENVTIHRVKAPLISRPRWLRLIYYWWFNIKALAQLLVYKPDTIFCYESASVWPAYAYINWFKKSVKLILHYHEYFTEQDYKRQMYLERYNHKLEVKYLYRQAYSISQTNKFRLKFFHNEYPDIPSDILRIIPNYPPKYWYNNILNKRKPISNKIRIVIVGSLSFESTYIIEVLQWAKIQNNISLHIVSYNLPISLKRYLNSLAFKYENITFFSGGIEYNKLPEFLGEFDVGLIIYKALSQNFKYNETNKLYEYLAAGLQVWYSPNMIGCNEIAKQIGGYRMVNVDYNNLQDIDAIQLISLMKDTYNVQLNAEQVFSEFTNLIYR